MAKMENAITHFTDERRIITKPCICAFNAAAGADDVAAIFIEHFQ